jgi:Malonyl-CoA decarboxylase C-terminal domain
MCCDASSADLVSAHCYGLCFMLCYVCCSTQKGLRGVQLGQFLIKRVVKQLQAGQFNGASLATLLIVLSEEYSALHRGTVSYSAVTSSTSLLTHCKV